LFTPYLILNFTICNTKSYIRFKKKVKHEFHAYLIFKNTIDSGKFNYIKFLFSCYYITFTITITSRSAVLLIIINKNQRAFGFSKMRIYYRENKKSAKTEVLLRYKLKKRHRKVSSSNF